MESIRLLLNENNENYEHFAYYETILEVIENNVDSNPDICIESCKSLIEGISKSIIKNFDRSTDQRRIDGKKFKPAFKEALSKLSEHNEEIETDFIDNAVSLMAVLGGIRNKRGDISHGKIAPKEISSSVQFSRFVVKLTEAIVHHLLEQFFSIDLSYLEEVKYEDNNDFNMMLDDFNIIDGISYSKALFEQDYDSYFQQLLEWEADAEAEEVLIEIE